MSFYSANEILDVLKTRLEQLPLEIADPSGEKLFQTVTYYRASNIQRAFEELYLTKQRLVILVPVRLGHGNSTDRMRVTTTRTLTVDLLLADRSFDKAATAALVGGEKNVGVIEMVERVIDSLFDEPLSLTDAAVEPLEGAPLLLAPEDRPNDPGRVCWIQTFNIRAGLRRAAVP